MSQQTLKGLLKPPFSKPERRDGFIVISDTEGHLLLSQDQTHRFLAIEDGQFVRNEFMDWVVTAMNEKWKRDFGKPLRWIKKYSLGFPHLECPKCTYHMTMHCVMMDDLLFCPHCGQRLLPPEEKAE
jgi:hypothetical protein